MRSRPPPLKGLRASHPDRGAQRRELYFFTLYRCFQAALVVFFLFSPIGEQVVDLHLPMLAQPTAIGYLSAAVLLLVAVRAWRLSLARHAAIGLTVDIVATLLIRGAVEGPDIGLALLLIVNIGAGALLLPFKWGIGFAIVASVGTVVEYLIAGVGPASTATLAETIMLAITYLTTAVLCHLLGRQLRESAELAERAGEEAQNLATVNELIIRRLHSGVLVVDRDNRIRLLNETGWHLLGEPKPQERRLEHISQPLLQRIVEWRLAPGIEPTPLQLRSDQPEVIPRFARLGTEDELVLVFLDDGALVSRRAEQLTLSTLGRLSASIAHEIRNPLGAISHAAQLLEESPDLPAGDRRLLDIILTHCQRMNGIVGNVLALSRRERSRPEPLELGDWAQRFVDDYIGEHFLDPGLLAANRPSRPVQAVFDPQQLHQVVTALVGNALTYGHQPGEAPTVSVAAKTAEDSGFPVIEVADRGPGIRPEVADRVFDPFFTTNELGSGLGLYIARQLCEANQAVLEYQPARGGGSCFRITLARPIGFGQDEDASAAAFAKGA
jgi:two-component system, NtrC family, sensor histidine kinase PilS